MRAILQRVKSASVSIEDAVYSSINDGLLVLVGIEAADGADDVEWMARKTVNMRIFNDSEGKMNDNIQSTNGAILLVSQFTLHASIKKGNRPSFMKAAKPIYADEMYEKFASELRKYVPVEMGKFGADMQISLLNDGPVTIWLDSKNKE